MKAALHWTVSDFPAYNLVSGWSTHGRLACPVCMESTKSLFLKNGKKHSWFDAHRQFLPDGHHFRSERNTFRKNCTEFDPTPRRRSGDEIEYMVNQLSGLPRVEQKGKKGKLVIPGHGDDHN